LFEDGDLSAARDRLESQSDSQHGSRDPEVYPLWDPSQLLVTSQLLLLKAATHQAGEDGSGSDDATSVNSEGEYGARCVYKRCTGLTPAPVVFAGGGGGGDQKPTMSFFGNGG